MAEVNLFGETYHLERKKLRGWLILEEINNQLSEAVEQKSPHGIESAVVAYVSTAFGISIDIIRSKVWWEVVSGFLLAQEANQIRTAFPIFSQKREKKEKDQFDYPGNSWHFWLNIFAESYSWTPEIVENLDVETAIGLLQEILISEQRKREWQWSLSQVAYSYDTNTRKTKFIELNKPDWMKTISRNAENKQPKTVKIAKSMMPVGLIIEWDESVNEQTN